MTLTHRLRAEHAAILIGSGTLLSDDPTLTVRLVQGTSPLRVVLDSRLRTPLTCKLLRSHSDDGAPQVVVLTAVATLSSSEGASRAVALRRAGARVLGTRADELGRVALRPALELLRSRLGVKSLMVEGGAAIIGSFASAHEAHQMVVTIAPMLVGGVRPLVCGGVDDSGDSSCSSGDGGLPRRDNTRLSSHVMGLSKLRDVHSFCLENDVVVSGYTAQSRAWASSADKAP